jgi:hypothetical protein
VFEFPAEKVVYVMTDFTWNNLKFWNEHESFRPYLDCGLLYALQHHHLALSFRLHHSNVVIGRNTLKNPICVVANYLFDTLCHDIFQASAYIVSLFTNHAAWKHRLKPVKSKKV